MGFYSPSQLVQDVRRHGVEVRPVDINCSAWDCTLEEDGALRLGFRLVKGLSRRSADRLMQSRPALGFPSVAAAQRQGQLARNDWDALAAAGALNSLGGHRYQARWELLAANPELALGDARVAENQVRWLPAPDEQADLEEDFRHLGLSLGRHPLALLRERGELAGCLRAEQLSQCRPGQLVRVAGVVTNRQRPGTASGVTFVTLEDESGQINLIVWRDTARAQRQALLGARLLKVSGVLEREGAVIHVVAGRLTDITGQWQALSLRSRDFH
ncbi:OB-fold nucleic acid binding domain-containing protein [Marinobacterium aestuariivivens]|uniref:Error-prone DNA polymerase n=1 Tax=Marinobacterium aestuariivivens TaxID=1698799 RepID=A0ABW2A0N0_9GAMM